MKKIINLSVVILTLVFSSCKQEEKEKEKEQKQIIIQPKISLGEIKNITTEERKIFVEGSADMEIVPDKIEVKVYMQEYLNEVFQKNKKSKYITTKVPLAEIEKELMVKLHELGISRKNIITGEVASYYKEERKKNLIGKNFTINITDPKLITKIISTITFRGIERVYLGAIDNTQIQKYRIKLRKEALIAAKVKAEYLLEAVDKKVGDVISINENGGGQIYSQNSYSNVSYCVSGSSSSNPDNFRKIHLTMNIAATFEIINK